MLDLDVRVVSVTTRHLGGICPSARVSVCRLLVAELAHLGFDLVLGCIFMALAHTTAACFKGDTIELYFASWLFEGSMMAHPQKGSR